VQIIRLFPTRLKNMLYSLLEIRNCLWLTLTDFFWKTLTKKFRKKGLHISINFLWKAMPRDLDGENWGIMLVSFLEVVITGVCLAFDWIRRWECPWIRVHYEDTNDLCGFHDCWWQRDYIPWIVWWLYNKSSAKENQC
jgi:hypothetical protein